MGGSEENLVIKLGNAPHWLFCMVGRLLWGFEDGTTLMLVYVATEDLRDTERGCSPTCTIRN